MSTPATWTTIPEIIEQYGGFIEVHVGTPVEAAQEVLLYLERAGYYALIFWTDGWRTAGSGWFFQEGSFGGCDASPTRIVG